jgi:quercetin dioxygenase-like cupin family protein
MAILHAQAGEVVDIRPLGVAIADSKTTALIKTHQFEIIRMVLLENKEIPVHSAKGDIIVQCLEGHVNFSTMEKSLELRAGHMFYLRAGEPHSLKAVEDSSLLLMFFS